MFALYITDRRFPDTPSQIRSPAHWLPWSPELLLCCYAAQDTEELLLAVRKVQARGVEAEDDILTVRFWRKVWRNMLLLQS